MRERLREEGRGRREEFEEKREGGGGMSGYFESGVLAFV